MHVPHPSTRPISRTSIRPTMGDLLDAVWTFVAVVVGLSVGIALVEEVSVEQAWAVPAAAAAISFVIWVLLVPVRWLADRLGGGVAFVLSTGVQIAAIWLALVFFPGLDITAWWGVLLVIVVSAIVLAGTSWLLGISDLGYTVGASARRGRRRARLRREALASGEPENDERPPGLLLVALDGVAEPVLRTALEAGLTPTLARWVASGSHRLERWHAQVPSTTPASFAGILHGKADHIPAFRWWDEERGRIVVANRFADAAAIEESFSDGDGLLAHDGAAVGTIFSGDAPFAQFVMSRTIGHKAQGKRWGSIYVQFFGTPLVFARSVVLAFGEMVKEVWQARRARVRGVHPRISRGGPYILLRAATNVTLRGLQASLVTRHMERGTSTIAVDFTDYDEVAHHAGPLRPEALRSLEGLDTVLATFEAVNEVAARRYRIVVLSDHGQTLGPTFEQVAGMPLERYLAVLMGRDPAAVETVGAGEEWGPVNALLNDVIGPARPRGTSRASVRGPDRDAARRSRRDAESAASAASEAAEVTPPVGARAGGSATGSAASPEAAPPPAPGDAVSVIASGNLALVWFTDLPGRTSLEELQRRWPGLVAGLAAHPAIGVVVVASRRGLLAVGGHGMRELENQGGDAVEGEDPLEAYPDPDAVHRDLLRAARLPHTGDLLLVSTLTAEGYVHAFEHQVGSHGGLGGEQNDAVLISPTELPRTGETPLVGADAVHRQLLAWQVLLGLRPRPESVSTPVAERPATDHDAEVMQAAGGSRGTSS